MTLTDPVANMLTIMRNAVVRNKRFVHFPFSKFKFNICQKLVKEKYLEDCQVKDNLITTNFTFVNKKPLIKNLKKISTTSCHVYLSVSKLKKYFSRPGLYLISTSRGLLTQREAQKQQLGGKMILFIN